MKLREWLKAEPGRCVGLAAHIGVTKSRVSQWSGEPDAPIPLKHYRAIVDFSGGEVTVRDLMSQDAELIGAVGAPTDTTEQQAA